MKQMKLVAVVLVVLVLFSGCASLAKTFGIASENYVDEQLAATRAELQATVDANKKAIDGYAEAAAQLDGLIASIKSTVETTDELKKLADVLQSRLENLPVDTIRQLVDILNQYLEDK